MVEVPPPLRGYWEDVLAGLRTAGGNGLLAEAVERALERSARMDAGLGSEDRRSWTMLERMGITRRRIGLLDDAVLGGRASRLFRHVQRVARRRPR